MSNRTRPTRSTRFVGVRLAVVAAILVALALVTLSQIGASEELIQAEPARGATVAEAPHQLLLTFNRPLAQLIGAHRVEVTDANGYRVDDGHADISTYSQRTLVVPVHAEGDGDLRVDYRVLLIGDGENLLVSSSYQFTVDHSAVPIEGEQLDASATAKSSQSLVLWTIAILIGLTFAGGMLYFLRMATGNSRSSLEPTNRTVFRE